MYEKISFYLNECVEKDALSHAYIFYGPDETAKKIIAMNFADKILNSTFEFKPDLMLISSDIDKELSIDLIRHLKKFLFLSPYFGKYKVVIVERAENLNLYAQNALLKIFEEAPSHAIIILCAKTIDSIPATIASRGVKLPFWKKNNIASFTDKNMLDFFNEILKENHQNLYLQIQKFNDYKTVEVFKLWLGFLRERFLIYPNKKLTDLLKVSQNIYFKLNETNINPKFAYDELILSLPITNLYEYTNSYIRK